MPKMIKYLLLVAVIGLLGYQSVYFKKLSTLKRSTANSFNATAYTRKIWEEEFRTKMDSAINLPDLMQLVTANQEAALNKHGNLLGIGNYRYALVKTIATIVQINEDDIRLQVPVKDSLLDAVLVTEYIYGNAIRDASGLVDIKDFPNSEDLNNISDALNKIVRSSVLPPFKQIVQQGDQVMIIAAVELNKENIQWPMIELYPVQLQIIK